MPLSRLLLSARQRSASMRRTDKKSHEHEFSMASLDDSKLGEAISCLDIQELAPPIHLGNHLMPPQHWNSASTLLPSPNANSDDRFKLGAPEVEKRRLRLTRSSAASADRAMEVQQDNHSSVKKKFSNFDDLSRLELSSEGYRLTGQQRELIKLCWQEAKRRQGEPGPFIFQWIFNKYPDMRMHFGNYKDKAHDAPEGNLKKHIQAFNYILEIVVGSVVDMDEPKNTVCLDDSTGPLLHSYGTRHAQIERNLGYAANVITTEHWDMFRRAMCEYVVASSSKPNMLSALTSASQKRNETLHAWRILVYYIIAKVKQGYEMEKGDKARNRGMSFAE